MNTIGPMNNWQETYDYYQLPFCHGDSPVQHHHETLGEALQGMDLINSGIPMSYLSRCPFELSLVATDEYSLMFCI
jgi:transmembrane 9 superfamily protein 3